MTRTISNETGVKLQCEECRKPIKDHDKDLSAFDEAGLCAKCWQKECDYVRSLKQNAETRPRDGWMLL